MLWVVAQREELIARITTLPPRSRERIALQWHVTSLTRLKLQMEVAARYAAAEPDDEHQLKYFQR